MLELLERHIVAASDGDFFLPINGQPFLQASMHFQTKVLFFLHFHSCRKFCSTFVNFSLPHVKPLVPG